MWLAHRPRASWPSGKMVEEALRPCSFRLSSGRGSRRVGSASPGRRSVRDLARAYVPHLARGGSELLGRRGPPPWWRVLPGPDRGDALGVFDGERARGPRALEVVLWRARPAGAAKAERSRSAGLAAVRIILYWVPTAQGRSPGRGGPGHATLSWGLPWMAGSDPAAVCVAHG